MPAARAGHNHPMSGWSFKLVRVAGIAVYVHWTFLLLLAVFAGSHLIGSADTPIEARLAAAGRAALFLLGVFGCVILHEFGHAMAARLYGIKTKDIYVLPIGGVARLERMPRSPLQEFVVAIAGPAVNVVIAIVLLLILGLGFAAEVLSQSGSGVGRVLSHGLLGQLLVANVLLVVFNLIPAFPMDGGRILRAALAAMMPYERATRAAVRVGQGVAVLMALFAIFGGAPMLILIAVFVFFGAQAELNSTQFRNRIEGLRVADAMQRRFVALRESDPIGAVAEFVRTGEQWDFPVVRDEPPSPDAGLHSALPPVLVGWLSRERLLELLTDASPASATPAAAVMASDPQAADAREPLHAAIERMQSTRSTTLPVVQPDADRRRLVGLLTPASINAALDWRQRRSAVATAAHTPTASPIIGR